MQNAKFQKMLLAMQGRGTEGKWGEVCAPEGAVTGGGWYYVLPDNLPHFYPPLLFCCRIITTQL